MGPLVNFLRGVWNQPMQERLCGALVPRASPGSNVAAFFENESTGPLVLGQV